MRPFIRWSSPMALITVSDADGRYIGSESDRTKMLQDVGRLSDAGGRRWLLLLFWFAVVAAVAVIGSWTTLPKIPTWYAGLVKPSFNPPNAVFGPAWSVLYPMMAVAAWRIGVPADPVRRKAIALFSIQLLL